MRCALFQARRSSTIFDFVGASSPANGSSSRSSRGSVTKARASATLWRSPPEISPGLPAQMRDAKRFEHSVCARAALGSIKTRDPVLNVSFDAEMRKQREILKDVTDPTRTHRNIDLHAVVKPGLVCARNAA